MKTLLDWGQQCLEKEWGVGVLDGQVLSAEELPWELAGRWEPQLAMPFTRRFRVRSSGPPSTPFLHNIRFPLTCELGMGTVGTVLVWLRARRGGCGVHLVEEVCEPYFTCARESFRVGAGWTQFWIPFRCPQDYPAGQLRYQIWLPTGPQELEIGGAVLYRLASWPEALAPTSAAPRVPAWKQLQMDQSLEGIPVLEQQGWERRPQGVLLQVEPQDRSPDGSYAWSLEAPVAEGDWLLLRAHLKGQGLVEHQLQGNRWDCRPWLWHFHELQANGQVMSLCFQAGSSAAPGEVSHALQLWQGDGGLEVMNLTILNFGDGERPLPIPRLLPAERRPSQAGSILPRPDFRLGCSVRLRQLDQPGYLDALCGWAGEGRGFNDLTPDWELTWKGWSMANPLQRSAYLQRLLRLRQAGMTLKGHFLVSNNPDQLPPELGFDLDDSALMLQHLEGRLESVLGCPLLAHCVDRWDLWNEAFTYPGLRQRLGKPDLLPWFRRARQLAPGMKLGLNEGSLLTAGLLEKTIREEMQRLSQELEGPFVLGLQGHFRGFFPTRQQLQDTLGGLSLPGWELEISELDWSGHSEDSAASFLEELLDVALACPQLTGLSLWGFSEQVEGAGQGMILDRQGALKPAGQVLKQRFFGSSGLVRSQHRAAGEETERVWNRSELELALQVGAPCHDRILQNAEELQAWHQWMLAKGVESYLEIGIWTGALLRYWKRELPQLRLAACDLGWAEQAGLTLKLPKGVDFLRASSQGPEFMAWRAQLGKVDVVMIDGDHEYAGVRADFERNCGFPHRFLVFHNVDNPNPELAGVRRFWEELPGYKLTLRGSDPLLRCGIGIWSQSEDPA